MTADDIKERLKQVKYPGFSRDIVSFGIVRSASFADGTARIQLALTTNDPKVPLQIKNEVDKCLRELPGVERTAIEVEVQAVRAPAARGNIAGSGPAPKSIRHAVAIGSGKGGVGKTTFAVNLGAGRPARLRHLRPERSPDDRLARAPRGRGRRPGGPSGSDGALRG
jgi:ATP-binding protein involved in chromosome partitioning